MILFSAEKSVFLVRGHLGDFWQEGGICFTSLCFCRIYQAGFHEKISGSICAKMFVWLRHCQLRIVILNQMKCIFFQNSNYTGTDPFTEGVGRALIYHPCKREQIWRFFTYMFLHDGWVHLCFNVFLQLIVGKNSLFILGRKKWRRIPQRY